ncbi:hypothetical protein [Azospirillum halopraeferens]|uniref:hypothetical protein n=1 Tax=Azospirillum halopraeferens TaxID=34010 RepID=UPI0003FE9C64|nr:hypothetical protein [Azospirillum halopraeferens]
MTAIAKPETPVFDTAPDDLKPVLESLADALAGEEDWALRKDALLEVLMAVDGMTALSPAQQTALARIMEQVEAGTLSEEEAERTLSALTAGETPAADGEASPPPDLLPMFIGAILERLDEPRITCAEQAGFYLLSVQPEHVEAAETWLESDENHMQAFQALLDEDRAFAALFDLLMAGDDGDFDDDDADDDDDDDDDGMMFELPDAANDDVPDPKGRQ